MFHQSPQTLSPLLQIQPIFQIIVPSEQDTKHSLSNPTHVSKLRLFHQKHQTLNNNKIRINFSKSYIFQNFPKILLHATTKKLQKAEIACISSQPFLLCKSSIFETWLPKTSWLLLFSSSYLQLAETRPDRVQSPTYSLFTLDLGCSI